MVSKYSVYANSGLFTYDEAKIFHASRHTVDSYFFRLFHRLDNFICYISDIFLPSRQRKFGNKAPNCVNKHNHFICLLFIQNTHAFTKTPHMSGKAQNMQYKYIISPNKQLATVWWCSWRWGWPPLNP